MRNSGSELRAYWLVVAFAWAGLAMTAPANASDRESLPRPGTDTTAAPARDGEPVILFLGTSLTAGYGLPLEQAYPALIQARVDAAGLDYRVVNAGVSGDTSAGGVRRIQWLMRMPVAVLVLELGANDMLRGLAPDAMQRNLQQIIDRTRTSHPAVRLVVAGMRSAPNLGKDYQRDFERVYPALARENEAALIPFVLDGVAGDSTLNQRDGIHPTADGHRRIAATVWTTLEPVVRLPGTSPGE
jgi:acyl-CoA thioesterase-1